MWEEITDSPTKESTKTTIPKDNDIYRVEYQNADIDVSQGQQGGRKNAILNQGYPKSKETIIREREKIFLYSSFQRYIVPPPLSS